MVPSLDDKNQGERMVSAYVQQSKANAPTHWYTSSRRTLVIGPDPCHTKKAGEDS